MPTVHIICVQGLAAGSMTAAAQEIAAAPFVAPVDIMCGGQLDIQCSSLDSNCTELLREVVPQWQVASTEAPAGCSLFGGLSNLDIAGAFYDVVVAFVAYPFTLASCGALFCKLLQVVQGG
jgi:hypothetical protein